MPFGALRHNGRFLAEDFSLSVVPSLSVAGGWASFPQPLVRPQATVLGNSLEDLQYASREAELVASMFQAAPLLGGDVMRAFINLASAEASILHVAGHIKFDEAIPEMSGIILADRTIMSVKDLSQSRQELALVVLSGCDSGKSFVTYGDNPISLGLSFLHTGARAVVFTLWEIDDIVTVDLMRNFYRVLLTGKSVDTALQMAQCALIKKRSKHPYYWAAFQMLGERIKLFIARKRNDSFNMRKVLHRFFR